MQPSFFFGSAMYEVRTQPCASHLPVSNCDDKEKKGVEESNRDDIRHRIRLTLQEGNTQIKSCPAVLLCFQEIQFRT